MSNHKENSEHQHQPDVTFPKFLSAGPILVRGSTIIKSTPCICVLTVFVFLFFFGGGLLLLEGMVWVWWHNPFRSLSAISERFRDYQDVNLDVLGKLIKRDKNG